MIIIGVYRIEAEVPCHLIEVEIDEGIDFDWDKVTQEVEGQPRGNWQAAFDEQLVLDAVGNWVFFFHCLDLSKPLLYSSGSVKLPSPTIMPEYLVSVEYEAP